MEEKTGGESLTPEALREFEGLLVKSLDRYQDELELGGLGNPEELAESVLMWTRTKLDRPKMDGGRSHNSDIAAVVA